VAIPEPAQLPLTASHCVPGPVAVPAVEKAPPMNARAPFVANALTFASTATV
jgi:hypothetical protein